MTILSILAIFSISFAIKEIDGPFGIIAKSRNRLMSLPRVGIFFYQLLECYFCLSCHSGWMVYLLSTPIAAWTPPNLILWIFAGGMIGILGDASLSRLQKDSA
jgi:hypothetical protein